MDVIRVPCVLRMMAYPARVNWSRLAFPSPKDIGKSIESKHSLQSLDHQLNLTHKSVPKRLASSPHVLDYSIWHLTLPAGSDHRA